MTQEHEVAGQDPYRWLEDVTGDEALDWVRDRNAAALAALSGSDRFESLRAQAREVLDADDRIPFVRRRGEYLYNFWQDADHPKGLWRRTTLAEYRKDQPGWEILLDVDALAAQEGENWVWQGAAVLRPGGYRLALVHLSRGGADASVVREFDVAERRFVPGGFYVPEAKTDAGWIDADRIYVGTDFGPGSLTSSGYPRLVKEWRRGTPMSEAAVVFEGKPDDVGVGAYHDPTEGFERDFVVRNIEFYRTEWWLRTGDGGLVQVAVPEDAIADVHREWLLIQTRSPWAVGGVTYPAGALLAARFEEFLAGERELTVLFEPDAHTSLSYHAWTRNHLILAMLQDVRRRLAVLTPADGPWQRSELPGVPEFSQRRPGGHRSLRQRRVHARIERLHPARHAALRAHRRHGGDAQAGAGVLRRHRADGAAVLRHLRATAPRCPTSSSGPQDPGPGRCCSPGTAVSRSRSPRPTAASSAAAGSPAAAPTWWPTSGAAASTGPGGTCRRSRKTGTWCMRTSRRWPRTWSPGASPPATGSASKAPATAAC